MSEARSRGVASVAQADWKERAAPHPTVTPSRAYVPASTPGGYGGEDMGGMPVGGDYHAGDGC